LQYPTLPFASLKASLPTRGREDRYFNSSVDGAISWVGFAASSFHIFSDGTGGRNRQAVGLETLDMKTYGGANLGKIGYRQAD
jgi:hypothetical protein